MVNESLWPAHAQPNLPFAKDAERNAIGSSHIGGLLFPEEVAHDPFKAEDGKAGRLAGALVPRITGWSLVVPSLTRFGSKTSRALT